MSLTERDASSFVFLCVCLCVCVGERGRGCESSGTGWESPPLSPGGTPSPQTSPSSPSPTTQWGTSVTHSLPSAMWVDLTMRTTQHCLKIQLGQITQTRLFKSSGVEPRKYFWFYFLMSKHIWDVFHDPEAIRCTLHHRTGKINSFYLHVYTCVKSSKLKLRNSCRRKLTVVV